MAGALARACLVGLCSVAAAAVPLSAARTRSTGGLGLPEMFSADVDIAAWTPGPPLPPGALNASFRLLYDGTAPGYHLSSTAPGARLEVSQSDALLAVDQFPALIPTWGVGCRVVPSAWTGWWEFVDTAGPGGGRRYLGLELCPGQAAGGTRLCDTYTPAGTLFDKVRLWTSVAEDDGEGAVPVALRWPVGLYFAAPLAGVEHQLLQLGEIDKSHIMIFRSFTPLGAGGGPARGGRGRATHTNTHILAAGVLPPFPDETACSYYPVQRSHLRCPPSATAAADRRHAASPRPGLLPGPGGRAGSKVVTMVLAHSPDMLVPGAQEGLGATLRLDNVNAADLMGEAFFFSLTVSSPLQVLEDMHLMSAVEVEVDPQWGVYQGCNYGVCEREMWKLPNTTVDPAFPAVGRLTIGDVTAAVSNKEVYDAQCGATKVFGAWFSLPAAGRCAGNASVGVDACTWRQLRVVKTVDTRSCFLRDKALMQAVYTWKKFAVPTCAVSKYCAPPKAMARAIDAALMSSDHPSAPGCSPL